MLGSSRAATALGQARLLDLSGPAFRACYATAPDGVLGEMLDKAKGVLKDLGGKDEDPYRTATRTAKEGLESQIQDGKQAPGQTEMQADDMKSTITAQENWRYENAEKKQES